MKSALIDGCPSTLYVCVCGKKAALVVVLIAGMIVHAPLTRVPENALKFGVGVMLTAFGIFWSAEGAGITWPGTDLSLLGLIVFVVVVSFGLVALVRRAAEVPELTAS